MTRGILWAVLKTPPTTDRVHPNGKPHHITLQYDVELNDCLEWLDRCCTPMKHPIACLGYCWKPYQYFKPLCPVRGEIVLMAIQALKDAGLEEYLPYMPDTGIINYFPVGSSLGMHQDKSESRECIEAGSPIVTISIGDTAIFRLGNCSHPGSPYQDLELRSGDLLIMSGFSRLAYHSVLNILPDTRPAEVNLPRPGRVSLTLRQVYPLKKR